MDANFSRQLVFFLERFGFTSGVKRLLSWKLEGRAITGQFVGEIAGRLRPFNFSIDENGLKYGIATNQKSDSYIEGFFLDSTKVQIKANSSYNQGKLAVLTRLDKKPDCQIGFSCGSSCISTRKECEIRHPQAKEASQWILQRASSAAQNPASKILEEVNKSASVIASAEIQKAESKIRNNPSESAVVVDARTGKTLVDRQGYKTGVFFTKDDISHFKGNVMTHNHPWLPSDGVTNKGISFSQEDIFTACGTQMAEMRACTSFYNHSMKPPKKGWDENFFNTKVKPSFEKHEKDVIQEFVAKIRNISDPTEIQKAAQLAETERFHLTWERVAKETGMVYSRTKVPNVNEDQIIKERQKEVDQEQKSTEKRKKLLRLAMLGIAGAFLLKNYYKQKGV